MGFIKKILGIKDYRVIVTNDGTGVETEYTISSNSEANAVIKCFKTQNLPNTFTVKVIS